jgi:hypothetical protein
MLCDLFTRKNDKLGILIFLEKSVPKTELSCMNIPNFQAKLPMIWPQSWHSLLKWSYIVQKCSTWNDKQCWWRKFSFSLHKKLIFHFLSATNRYFCEGGTKIQFENWTKTISKNIEHLGFKDQHFVEQKIICMYF